MQNNDSVNRKGSSASRIELHLESKIIGFAKFDNNIELQINYSKNFAKDDQEQN